MIIFNIATSSYRFNDFSPLLKGPVKISIDNKCTENIIRSNKLLMSSIDSGEIIYGVNTGFGKLSQIVIDKSQQTELQYNLVRSHAAGIGNSIDTGLVRIAMVLKLLTFSKGYSGVSLDVVEKIIEFLNHDLIPVVPEKGSAGASGDLAPLANMTLGLIGEGKISFLGKVYNAKYILNKKGIEPLKLSEKSGLSLVNGTQISTAFAIKNLIINDILIKTADIIGSVSVEASLSSREVFKSAIHDLKKHPGQVLSAKNIWNLLKDSEIVNSHKSCDVVQDPYSFRCIPHIHGACRDAMDGPIKMINNEINSVSDNPLILKSGTVEYSGHFHAEHVAQALDFIAISTSELGAISERRTHYFMKGANGKLPLFLAIKPGVESGYMIPQVVASTLASENKTLSHPGSVDSIPTSGGQEDLVSMAPWCAIKLNQIQENLGNILAIELLISSAATILYHSKYKPGIGTKNIISTLKNTIPFKKGDRVFSDEINVIYQMIISGEIINLLDNNIKLD